jgi:neutral ceramidase
MRAPRFRSLETSALFCLGVGLLGCSAEDRTPSAAALEQVAAAQLASTGCDASAAPLNIGAGIGDVTGPITDIGTGYNDPGATMTGLAMRLHARAFVVESPCNGKRVVLASVESLHLYQGVAMGVLAKLRQRYGDLYTAENVMIASTHAHAAPTNFSWRTLYNLFSGVVGYDSLQYDLMVKGITDAIVQAHESKRPAPAAFAKGDAPGVGHNRSLPAYAKNPDRGDYASEVDQTMSQLRFDGTDGTSIGLFNWIGVHGTSLSKDNHLLHPDNKGIAAYSFDKADKSQSGFVAAFAQGAAGDVSPNVPNPADLTLQFLRPSDLDKTLDEYDNPKVHGALQYQFAKGLFDAATTAEAPIVDVRQAYVDFSNIAVDPKYSGKTGATTCTAAVGLGLLAGTEEGSPDITRYLKEGSIVYGGVLGKITLSPALQKCHEAKLIVLPVGDMSGVWVNKIPWVDTIVPLQIIRIGSVAIVDFSFEATTMLARRLRNRLSATLAPMGIKQVVIGSMTNGYNHYATTTEEYGAQNYEGASNHFGPNAATALEQKLDELAAAFVRGDKVATGPLPPDLSDAQTVHTPIDTTGVVTDGPGAGKVYGGIVTAPPASVKRGTDVTVVFRTAHPRTVARLTRDGTLNRYARTPFSFVEVQKSTPGGWVTVANDTTPQTRFTWARTGGSLSPTSEATIVWETDTAEPGEYRIVHNGVATESFLGLGRKDLGFSGTSPTFRVE